MNKNQLVSVLVKMRASADDKTALEGMALYPAYKIGKDYKASDRIVYGELLYKVRQEHTSAAEWPPDSTPALYEVINVTHAGTLDDPIPFAVGMEVYADTYYSYNGKLYHCFRASGQAIYNTPDTLIDVYFTEV